MSTESNPPTSKLGSSGAPASTRSSCNISQVLRESVAAIISLAIAFVALRLLWEVHDTAKNKFDLLAFGHQKDVLLLALGFLGTVTGYYFGRVPAERHADAARDAANAAQEREQEVRQRVHQGLSDIQKTHNQRAEGVPTPTDPVNKEIDRVRASL